MIRKLLAVCLSVAALLPICTACNFSGEEGTSSPAGSRETVADSLTTAPITTLPGHDRYDPLTQTAPVYVSYLAGTGGYLSGVLGQTLTADNPECTTVRAKPDLGYRFVGWSDGATDPVREKDSFAVDTVLTAYFEPDLLNLPAIHLDTDIAHADITTDEYVGGSLSVTGCAEEYRLEDFATQVRGRGHGSWTYEKKGWKLKLSEGRSLLGLGSGKARKWVLIANQIDRSLLRNAAATWIQQRLEMSFVADYAFVDLYLNGVYMGVYQLYEQIEEDEHKISVPMGTVDDVSYFAELTVHAEAPYIGCDSKLYQIHSDLPEEGDYEYLTAVAKHLRGCFAAVKSGDRERIEALIDVDSLVNAYIVEELTKNLDPGWDSFYLYRNCGGKLTFGPVWDFDMSSGNVTASEGSVCHDTFQFPDGLYAGNLAARQDKQQNHWFMAICDQDWFLELVQARWRQVYPSLCDLPEILLSTGACYEAAFERNFDRWRIMRRRLSSEADVILTMNSCMEQISYLSNWYRQRISWLNGQWGESS